MLKYAVVLCAFIAVTFAANPIRDSFDGKRVCCLRLQHTYGLVEEQITKNEPRYEQEITKIPCTRDELSWSERMRNVKKICSTQTRTHVKYETVTETRTVSRIINTDCPSDRKTCCHGYVTHQGSCKPSNEVLGGAVGIVHGVTKDILGDDQGIDWEKEVSNFFDPQG